MGQKLHARIEVWKKHLLDFGKRNRLINFSEGRGHEIKIIHPSCEELYEAVVLNESEMFFPYARKVKGKRFTKPSFPVIWKRAGPWASFSGF